MQLRKLWNLSSPRRYSASLRLFFLITQVTAFYMIETESSNILYLGHQRLALIRFPESTGVDRLMVTEARKQINRKMFDALRDYKKWIC
jgi:hypothetical protein